MEMHSQGGRTERRREGGRAGGREGGREGWKEGEREGGHAHCIMLTKMYRSCLRLQPKNNK